MPRVPVVIIVAPMLAALGMGVCAAQTDLYSPPPSPPAPTLPYAASRENLPPVAAAAINCPGGPTQSSILGAIVGGLVGSQIGQGSGRVLASGVGAAVGGVVGCGGGAN